MPAILQAFGLLGLTAGRGWVWNYKLHAPVRKTVKWVTPWVFANPLSYVQLKGTELYTTVIRWRLGE